MWLYVLGEQNKQRMTVSFNKIAVVSTAETNLPTLRLHSLLEEKKMCTNKNDLHAEISPANGQMSIGNVFLRINFGVNLPKAEKLNYRTCNGNWFSRLGNGGWQHNWYCWVRVICRDKRQTPPYLFNADTEFMANWFCLESRLCFFSTCHTQKSRWSQKAQYRFLGLIKTLWRHKTINEWQKILYMLIQYSWKLYTPIAPENHVKLEIRTFLIRNFCLLGEIVHSDADWHIISAQSHDSRIAFEYVRVRSIWWLLHISYKIDCQVNW